MKKNTRKRNIRKRNIRKRNTRKRNTRKIIRGGDGFGNYFKLKTRKTPNLNFSDIYNNDDKNNQYNNPLIIDNIKKRLTNTNTKNINNRKKLIRGSIRGVRLHN
jgi:hypothetical protein